MLGKHDVKSIVVGVVIGVLATGAASFFTYLFVLKDVHRTVNENKDKLGKVSVAVAKAHPKSAWELVDNLPEPGSETIMTYQNGAKEGVVTTESGLKYRIIEDAEGDKPAETDTVVVHYRGTLLDGTEFDSSIERREPAIFPLNTVITGWQEALQLMSVGSKWEVYIPPELAYGVGGRGPIPPSSALIFEVELLEINPES